MTSTKDIKSLRADFNRRKSNGDNAFIDFEDFKSWYEAQEKVCNYCGLKEEESQIIVTTILTSNRFPKNGKPGRGTARGMHLEVDRINPREKYSRINCTLCCYFCNNDKSDVFDGVEYKKFFQNRVNYLRQLIQNKNGV